MMMMMGQVIGKMVGKVIAPSLHSVVNQAVVLYRTHSTTVPSTEYLALDSSSTIRLMVDRLTSPHFI